MSLGNSDIQGNANVSRNVNAGGNATVRGNVIVEHNLVVRGWVDAPNIKGALKGLYASEADLKASYPRPMPGWFALVGDTLPADVWRVEGGKWVPTGEKGGEFSVYLDRLESDVGEIRDSLTGIEDLLSNRCMVLGDTIIFSATGDAAFMSFEILNRDGSKAKVEKNIPVATVDAAGMMSAADKRTLDLYKASRLNYLELNMFYNEDSVELGYHKTKTLTGEEKTTDVILNAATPDTAGVMSSADKRKLDSLADSSSTIAAITVEEIARYLY